MSSPVDDPPWHRLVWVRHRSSSPVSLFQSEREALSESETAASNHCSQVLIRSVTG